MADTAFDGFTLVTSLQDTDVLLGMRGAGGINFPASLLVRKTSAGLVGIGTNSPVGLLDLSGTNPALFFSYPALATDEKRWRVRAISGYFNIEAVNDGVTASAPAYSIGRGAGAAVYSHQWYSGGAERLRLDDLGALRPGADNAQPNGTSTRRWSVFYAATGTIYTSDEREKIWIGIREDSRAVWLRIANRIFGELGLYQWRDAVEEKGEESARMHFGTRAQRVWQIVADEGLAPPLVDGLPVADWDGPPPPAFLCFDEWEAEHVEEPVYAPTLVGEDGKPLQTGTRTVVSREAGNRFGFRIDQLGLLLNWALHQRLTALEAA